MACAHLSKLSSLRQPKLSESVHREECTQCFDNQDLASGIDVCLTCFNGGCVGNEDRHHARTHAARSGHPFSLNVKRTRKPSKRGDDQEPPQKVTKLAISEEREEDKYEWATALRCWECIGPNGGDGTLLGDAVNSDPKVKHLVEGIMTSMSSARQSEVKAWEEEILPCEHTLTLHQETGKGHIDQAGLAHCASCDLRENLWLCLTCGSLGCGRQQFGGVSGNGHALTHYKSTGHAAAVKLGTITAEGSADIYCYACDDGKLDPELGFHLSTFGINILSQKKTEKSMTELQIEQNFSFDFSITDEHGRAFQPLFGPGLTGLRNLGNSCYMASVLQTLFALPAFRARYSPSKLDHTTTCTEPLPASCVECQMRKVADGLLSGRYAVPDPNAGKGRDAPALFAKSDEAMETDTGTEQEKPVVFQEGIKPTTFKALVGKGHAEFATMKQQDAEEFLAHLFKTLRVYARKVGTDEAKEPTEIVKFGMEQRLQCGKCKRVRYKVDEMDLVSVPVPAVEKEKVEGKPVFEDVKLEKCLDLVCGEESLQYRCPVCAEDVFATKSSRFKTFPDVLIIHAKKFQLVNWVPTKLDIPVILPDVLTLDSYVGKGLQASEEALPEDGPTGAGAPATPAIPAEALAQLEGMGFPTIRCKKALLANNMNVEQAMEWIFMHMEDPDIDAPIPQAGGTPEPPAHLVEMIVEMGFSPAQAKKALKQTSQDTERAIEWLFNHPDDAGEDDASSSAPAPAAAALPGSDKLPASYRLKAFISHKGPSVHSGHYVAHIRDGDEWVMFNDEKVVKADKESVDALRKLAYLYVFERV